MLFKSKGIASSCDLENPYKKSAYTLWISHKIVPDQALEPEYSQHM